MYTEQDRYGGVPEWWADTSCGDRHHTFIIHKYRVKYTSKQRNQDRFKSESRGDTNQTLTCVVPVHAPQTNSLWSGVEAWNRYGTAPCVLLCFMTRCWGIVTVPGFPHEQAKGARTNISFWESLANLLTLSFLRKPGVAGLCTLHLDYVAGYTGPLLYLFEQT